MTLIVRVPRTSRISKTAEMSTINLQIVTLGYANRIKVAQLINSINSIA